MYCPNCGTEVKDGYLFCTNCGTAIRPAPADNESNSPKAPSPPPQASETGSPSQPPHSPEPAQSARTSESPQSSVNLSKEKEQNHSDSTVPPKTESTASLSDADIIGTNEAYYIPQFEKIRSGEKGSFNAAAFFLSLYHSAYRGTWKKWLSFMKIPLIVLVGSSVVAFISIMATQPILMIAAPVIALASSILSLIWGIRYGLNFNKFYLEYVEQQKQSPTPTLGTSGKRVVIVLIIIIAITVIPGLASVGGFTTGLLTGTLNYDIGEYDDYDDFFDDSETPPAEEDSDPEPEVSNETEPEYEYDEYEDEDGYVDPAEARFLMMNEMFVGTWTAYRYEEEYESGSIDENYTLVFHGDGTGYFQANGVKSTFTWDAGNTMTGTATAYWDYVEYDYNPSYFEIQMVDDTEICVDFSNSDGIYYEYYYKE